MASPDILEMDFDSYLETIRRFTDEELIPGEAADRALQILGGEGIVGDRHPIFDS